MNLKRVSAGVKMSAPEPELKRFHVSRPERIALAATVMSGAPSAPGQQRSISLARCPFRQTGWNSLELETDVLASGLKPKPFTREWEKAHTSPGLD